MTFKDRLLTASTHALLRERIVAGDALGEFNTATLLEVLYAPQNDPSLTGFWLQFFGRTINFDTEEVRFDGEDLNEYRLAPFVSPNVQGRVMRDKGYEVKNFRPAYVKPKHVVDPSRSIPRRAGERPGGTLSLQQRYDAIVADNLRRERLMIENRWDWMACQALTTGGCVVRGDDYPMRVLNFGRDASLTMVLAGAAKWDQATAAPMQDLQLGRTRSFGLSRSPVKRMVFGIDAWNAFIDPSHTDVMRLLDNMRRGGNSEFNTAGLLTGGNFEYQGQISGAQGAGRLELYTYNNFFEEVYSETGALLGIPGGTKVPYLDSGTVVGIGEAVEGIRCFGAIMDKRAGLQALDMFPKTWDDEDPSVSYTMTQSAPLMVPARPNNTFSIKVV